MSQILTPPSVSTRIQVYKRTSKGIVLVDAPERKRKAIEPIDDTDETERMIEIWQEKRRRLQTSFFNYLCHPTGFRKQNYQLSEITERLER
jgi:hypothetical protein